MRTLLLAIGLLGACATAYGCDDGSDQLTGGGGDWGGAKAPPAATPAAPSDATSAIAGGAPLGFVPIRRLNRAEYNNTVRDLLGDTSKPADAFPADVTRGGFSNNAEALTLSPLLVELYAGAAEALVKTALAPARRGALVHCDLAGSGEVCAQETLSAFATRAYRRPLTADDGAELVAVFRTAVAAGDSPDEALGVALRVVLTSPYFLFRVEPRGGEGPQGAPVDGYALASRLSYFLWGSTPDAALFDAAATNKLGTRAEIDAHARRMLADPKSRSLIESFGGEWVLARMAGVNPSKDLFPKYDDALKTSMIGETNAFLETFILGDRSLLEALTAKDTFVDSRLALHYGLTDPGGGGFTKVDLPVSSHRGGLLRQASVLAMTSVSTRGSPTRRGAWILENLMCAPPPPPPPSVPSELPSEHAAGLTLRQKLEMVDKDPACAGCHAITDPIGLGLEHFDGIGAYRDKDNGLAVDASGTLPGGTKFDGDEQLTQILAQDPRFTSCAAQKLYAYATGKEVTASETERTAALGKVMVDAGNRLPTLALQIVNDVSFRNRVR